MLGTPQIFSSLSQETKRCFFIYFSVTKSQTSCLHSHLFVCFQILVPHGWFLTRSVVIYACVHACVRLCVCACVCIYMSVIVDVVVVGTSCEVSCVIFLLVVGYDGS